MFDTQIILAYRFISSEKHTYFGVLKIKIKYFKQL